MSRLGAPTLDLEATEATPAPLGMEATLAPAAGMEMAPVAQERVVTLVLEVAIPALEEVTPVPVEAMEVAPVALDREVTRAPVEAMEVTRVPAEATAEATLAAVAAATRLS